MNDPHRASEVYYDGACPVCSREIAFYQNRISPAAVKWRNVAKSDNPAPDLTRDEAMARFHIRRVDGVLVSGAAAFLALWRNDRHLRWLACAVDRQPFLWILEISYLGFLRVRRLWR